MQQPATKPFVFTAPSPSRRALIHSHDEGKTPSFIAVHVQDTMTLPREAGYQPAPGRYRVVFLQPVYPHVEGRSNPAVGVADFRMEMN